MIACRSVGRVHDELLDELERGAAHRFADFAGIPRGVGAGVYTISNDGGGLVYAGAAGAAHLSFEFLLFPLAARSLLLSVETFRTVAMTSARSSASRTAALSG